MFTTKLNYEELEKATFISKLIYMSRNDTIYDKNFTYPNSIITKAKEELILFKNTQTQVNTTTRSNIDTRDQ